MDCVKCSGKLEPVKVASVTVDRCGSCQGIWFDKSELTGVLQAYQAGEAIPLSVPSPDSKRQNERSGTCPDCDEPLERSETLAVEGLFWDACASCGGAWLDGGELTAIAADPEAAATAAFFAKS